MSTRVIRMNQGAQFPHTGYYYMSLRGIFGGRADMSGHAIAAYIDPDAVCRYFDPNHGEFETDTLQETLLGIRNLVGGYQIRDLTVYWCCWR